MPVSPIPARIRLSPGQWAEIIFANLDEELPSDEDADVIRIAIDRDVSPLQQHYDLCGILCAVAVERLHEQEALTSEISEDDIYAIGSMLFPMLALSGLWKGVPIREAETYFRALQLSMAAEDHEDDDDGGHCDGHGGTA